MKRGAGLFEELIGLHGRRLFGLCRKLCANEQDAQDLYQETWLKAFRFRSRYDSSRDFEGWLTGICVNAWRDAQRKRARKNIFAVFGSDGEKDRAMESAAVQDDDDFSDVREAVARLPDKHRAVITLYYWTGHDTARIAEILSIPQGTVKYRLHKARELLKERLETYGRKD